MVFLAAIRPALNSLKPINDWSIAFKNMISIDSAYLDFAKAFDTVSHRKLIYKLESYRIKGHLLAWIETFLSNCSQCIQVGDCLSSSINVISEVPQGSILGPILFILYINYISDFFTDSTVTVKLNADDAKLYSCIQCADYNAFFTVQFRFRVYLVDSLAAIPVC